jgi:aryl-alcohol dehydrogenase-like predicted oxidoreductase
VRTIELTSGGPEISELGLGCNNFGHNPFGTFVDYECSAAVVQAAVEAGYTFFDTADVYGAGDSETYLGRALGGDRASVVVATKFGYPMPDAPDALPGSRDYIRWAVHGSLRRLGTDYLDLCQMHRTDPDTPIAETLGALQELVVEGKVRHIGAAGFTADDLVAAAAAAHQLGIAGFVTCMTRYSLLSREAEAMLIPACVELGIRIHPYFPLESGLLTGKYTRGDPNVAGRLKERAAAIPVEVWDSLDGLRAFADRRGVPMLAVALGGLAAMPGVGPVVAGATRPEQVVANAKAIGWRPSAADLEQLRALPWSSCDM